MTREEFNELRSKRGTYYTIDQKNGTIIALTQEAYISGTNDEPFYTAHAVDKDGNEYIVKWDVMSLDCEDESEACDWDKYSVTAL